MGIKLSSKGRLIIITIGLLMISSALLFQNCSPTTLETDADQMYGDEGTLDGDSRFRLPAGFNETLNTGATCQVAINSADIPVGGTLTYTVSTTGTIPAVYRIYAYGTKNGVPDASEITPSYATNLVESYTNPGYIGGTYTRYFQIRDSAGRVLCQTNAVTVRMAGQQCTLTTPTPTLRQGSLLVLNTAYAAGTAPPTESSLVTFEGTNNGLTIAPAPYGQTDFTTYTQVMSNLDVGSEYIRRIVVRNADQSIYCQTNSVRFTVLQ